jgi:hypothetical protein
MGSANAKMTDSPRLKQDRFVLYPWVNTVARHGRKHSERSTTADNPTNDGRENAELSQFDADSP